jgi:hypothetical protein
MAAAMATLAENATEAEKTAATDAAKKGIAGLAMSAAPARAPAAAVLAAAVAGAAAFLLL